MRQSTKHTQYYTLNHYFFAQKLSLSTKDYFVVTSFVKKCNYLFRLFDVVELSSFASQGKMVKVSREKIEQTEHRETRFIVALKTFLSEIG